MSDQTENKNTLDFLQSIQDGQDPRHRSEIVEFIEQINNTTGLPDPDQWRLLCQLIYNKYSHQEVTLSQSIKAATEIAAYLHAKPKHSENESKSTFDPAKNPLTDSEILQFERTFNEHF